VRLAIVHDYLVQYGGAERVVEALHELWPDAPVFTSLYERDRMPSSFAAMDVRMSFLQRLPAARRSFKAALPFYPAAMRSLDVSGYDVVVSSSSGWAHGVRPAAGARHIVYCHTPARWLYRTDSYVAAERWAAAPLLPLLRRWDQESAARPTDYLANSQAVRERIARVYGRPARVVYPPVETRRFFLAEPDDYYLCVSRLNPYKRIDLAVRACEALGRRLLVVGDGPARHDLRRLAGARTAFLGRVPDDNVAALLARCRALIVPAEEDFCITAVEAMASGRPVVGYARGGLLETVVPERTGVLFPESTPESLARGLVRLERLAWDAAAIRRHALRFDVRRFGAELREVVEARALAAA
jgi:glycosyltransferase involved in cell wall biosynthesis